MSDSSPALMEWLEAHTARAPAALRERVLARAAEAPGAGALAARLAAAAGRVLAIVEEHPGDRSIALDLLAADALITLALLAQAETAPEHLGRFAAELLRAERAG